MKFGEVQLLTQGHIVSGGARIGIISPSDSIFTILLCFVALETVDSINPRSWLAGEVVTLD